MRWTTYTGSCTGTIIQTGSWKKCNARPQVDQPTIQDTTTEVFISVSYMPWLSEEFRRIFKDTKVQRIFKGCNTLKSLLMHPLDKIPPHLCQDVVYQWTCPEETCSSSYIGKSSRCLENRIKENNTSTTSAIYQHSSTHNHHKADILHFKLIDQDSRHLFREAREAIHIIMTASCLLVQSICIIKYLKCHWYTPTLITPP